MERMDKQEIRTICVNSKVCHLEACPCGSLLTEEMVRAQNASEEIFRAFFEASEGDYVLQASVMAGMKPNGW